MNLRVDKEALDYLTVNEYAAAKQIKKDMQEYRKQDYVGDAAIAARAFCKVHGDKDYVVEIHSCDAEIVRDCHTPYNQFGDGTGLLNIWITAVAELGRGFLKIGFLITDAWAIDGSDETAQALVDHAYIRYFPEETR